MYSHGVCREGTRTAAACFPNEQLHASHTSNTNIRVPYCTVLYNTSFVYCTVLCMYCGMDLLERTRYATRACAILSESSAHAVYMCAAVLYIWHVQVTSLTFGRLLRLVTSRPVGHRAARALLKARHWKRASYSSPAVLSITICRLSVSQSGSASE